MLTKTVTPWFPKMQSDYHKTRRMASALCFKIILLKYRKKMHCNKKLQLGGFQNCGMITVKHVRQYQCGHFLSIIKQFTKLFGDLKKQLTGRSFQINDEFQDNVKTHLNSLGATLMKRYCKACLQLSIFIAKKKKLFMSFFITRRRLKKKKRSGKHICIELLNKY